jgi:hypothetical protein
MRALGWNRDRLISPAYLSAKRQSRFRKDMPNFAFVAVFIVITHKHIYTSG